MGDKILVCCAWPAGLVLRLGEFKEKSFPGGMNGWHVERIWEETARETLAGGGAALRGQKAAKPGFGLTWIDKSFWEQWIAQNPDNDMVKAGLLFAARDRRRAKDQVKDHAAIDTGVEPLDTTSIVVARDPQSELPIRGLKDARVPKYGRVNGNIAGDGAPF